MCPPKPKAPPPPPPPPAAPPPPAETATGFTSAGRGTSNYADASSVIRRGIDSLRVDLNIPRANDGRGVYVP